MGSSRRRERNDVIWVEFQEAEIGPAEAGGE